MNILKFLSKNSNEREGKRATVLHLDDDFFFISRYTISIILLL